MEKYARPDLIEWVNKQSITIHCDPSKIQDMREWCLEHVGEQRMWHPLHEAEGGWIDFFEGDWAVTGDHFRGYNFWFARLSYKTQFALRFG